jgi:hypothetical protein
MWVVLDCHGLRRVLASGSTWRSVFAISAGSQKVMIWQPRGLAEADQLTCGEDAAAKGHPPSLGSEVDRGAGPLDLVKAHHPRAVWSDGTAGADVESDKAADA